MLKLKLILDLIVKKPLSTGVKTISNVPPYNVHIPNQILIDALSIISQKHRLTKKELAKLALENNLIKVNALKGNETQATFASLNKNIIQPLYKNWKLIDIQKIGRNHWITLNDDGQNAIKFLVS